MVLVRKACRLGISTLVGMSILMVGIDMAANSSMSAGYILILGGLVGCNLVVRWGLQ